MRRSTRPFTSAGADCGATWSRVCAPGGRFESVPGVGHNLAAEASKRLVAAAERLLLPERERVAA